MFTCILITNYLVIVLNSIISIVNYNFSSSALRKDLWFGFNEQNDSLWLYGTGGKALLYTASSRKNVDKSNADQSHVNLRTTERSHGQ